MLNLNGIERQEVLQVGMTSKLAKEYLEKYANLEAQRPIKKQRIKSHLNNIKNGLFMSSQIVIGHYYENEDHRTTPKKSILDGHHRLHAIVEFDTQDEIQVEILKVYAEKETIRQLYGFFDSKKSSRDLQDLLRWKTAYHPDLKNRWSVENLVSLASALPYASGHYFTTRGNTSFTLNCTPKGVSMGKDDFLSDSLDTRRWWYSLDQLNEFLNDLRDRHNFGAIRSSLGNIVYGVFLKSFDSLSDRGRRGESYNKTKDFWNAVVNGIADMSNDFSNTPALIKRLLITIQSIKILEKSGQVGKGASVAPIFYTFNQALDKWLAGANVLNLTQQNAQRKTKKNVIDDFFGKGESFREIHPVFKENKYWEASL